MVIKLDVRKILQGHHAGGAQFAGPENDSSKIFNSWKMQDLENDGPRARYVRTGH